MTISVTRRSSLAGILLILLINASATFTAPPPPTPVIVSAASNKAFEDKIEALGTWHFAGQ